MALGLWCILIAASANAQTTVGAGEVQILPRVDGTDTGSLRFREKNANGQDAVRISAPDAVDSGGYRVRLPAAQGTGALKNDGSGNLSWGTSGLQYWTEGDGSPDPVGSLVPVSSLSQHIGSSAAYVEKLWVKDTQTHSTGVSSWSSGASNVFSISATQWESLDSFGASTAKLTYSSGNIDAKIFNMTGSAYRVSGTSVIDSLRQGRFTNIIDEGSDTYISLNQTNGLSNSSGTIQFLRSGTQLGELDYDAFNGFQFGTSTFTGSFAPVSYKWQLDHRGDFYPVSSGAYDLGSVFNLVRVVYAQTHYASSTGKFYAVDGFGTERARVDSIGLTLYASGGAQSVAAESSTGTITANIFNAVGTGYRVAGTTVIDSAKTIRSGNVYPDGDATRNLGDLTLRWNTIYGTSMYATSQVFVAPSGTVRASMSGSGLIIQNGGGTTVATINSTAGNITSVGTISSSGGYIAGGLSGISVTCGAGLTVRQPQYVGGILVSGTCGF